jgi:hypothetical protein
VNLAFTAAATREARESLAIPFLSRRPSLQSGRRPAPVEHFKPGEVVAGWGRELEAGRYDPTVGVVTKLARVLRVRVTELLE